MPALKRLILVKHSLPAIQPDQPAAAWSLGTEGLQRCQALADCLRAYQPLAIYTSSELKARQTADETARLLSQRAGVWPNLHEHERSQVGYLTRPAFEAAVANFFARPDELVFGSETANQALERFELAIAGLLEAAQSNGTETLVVVAHGTVISLFVARHSGLPALATWQALDLPGYLALDLPAYTLREAQYSLSKRTP